MKIVTLIQDGFGRLHLLATPAPDLVRREYVAATGNAELLWCGVAPTYLGGKAIVEEVRSWFQHDPVEGLRAGSDEVIRCSAVRDRHLAAPASRHAPSEAFVAPAPQVCSQGHPQRVVHQRNLIIQFPVRFRTILNRTGAVLGAYYVN